MKMAWKHPEIDVEIEDMSDGRRRIVVIPRKPDVFIAKTGCETAYPLDLIRLIYEVKGPAWICDEIDRDENSSRVAFLIQKVIFAYVSEISLCGKRILDFGCGAGSSTMWLARLFPESEIVGVDIDEQLLQIARQRVSHYGYKNIAFVPSPSGVILPQLEGTFDFVVLSAVYEHLLPHERKEIFPQIYSHLKSCGIMFIMETPNRHWPIEGHTTRLPFINFFPAKLACLLAHAFCSRISREETWDNLLRRGIRGGSVGELMTILRKTGDVAPYLLRPCRNGFRDRIDLCWPGSERSLSKRLVIRLLKLVEAISGISYVPDLELAVQKGTR